MHRPAFEPHPRYLQRGSRAWLRANLALFAAGFATFSSMYAVQPLMPAFSREFGVSAAISSLALSMTTGVLAFTLLIAGLMSQALERKPVMIASLVSSAVLSIAAAVAPGWWTLLAARALEGIALGGVPALAIAYLSEEVEPRELGTAMGLYIAGNATGGMGGRVISGLLAEFADWRLALAAIGVIGLVATVIFIRLLPPSTNFRARRGMSLAEHAGPLVEHLRHPALPWVFVSAFLLMGGFVSVYNYVAYRLSGAPFELGEGAIGAVFVVYILGIVTSPVAGRLADRIGRAPVLVFGFLCMAVGLAVMWPAVLPSMVVGMALVTIGFFAGHSSASGWVGLLAERGKGHAAGLYLLGYYLGSSLVGTAGGLFWNAGGWPGVTAMVSGVVGAGVLIAFGLLAWSGRTPNGDAGTMSRASRAAKDDD